MTPRRKPAPPRTDCEACHAADAHPTSWRRVTVRLCDRCDADSTSKTSEYEVKLDWADDEMSYFVVRVKRGRA